MVRYRASDHSPNPFQRWWKEKKVYLALGLLGAGGSILADHEVHAHTHYYDSKIVAGADAKVVGHRDTDALHTRGTYKTVYELILEQCPADVQAAEAGQPHQQSFDQPDAVCYVDSYAVSPQQYDATQDGTVITLPGKLGTHVQKTNASYTYDYIHPVPQPKQS